MVLSLILYLRQNNIYKVVVSFRHPKKKAEKYPHIADQLQRLSFKTFVIM